MNMTVSPAIIVLIQSFKLIGGYIISVPSSTRPIRGYDLTA